MKREKPSWELSVACVFFALQRLGNDWPFSGSASVIVAVCSVDPRDLSAFRVQRNPGPAGGNVLVAYVVFFGIPVAAVARWAASE
jgi:hypothetical protein